MTEKERTDTLIETLLEAIRKKNNDIFLRDWQIEDLKKRLDEAEKIIAEQAKGDTV